MFCPTCRSEITEVHKDLDDCIAALSKFREQLEADLKRLVEQREREEKPVETGITLEDLKRRIG